jgi:hypothetical protein
MAQNPSISSAADQDIYNMGKKWVNENKNEKNKNLPPPA